MITAFHLSDNTASGPRAFMNLFRHNRIRVEHRYCDAVALKSVTYERYRGRVNWTSIDRFIDRSRGQLLCSEDTDLPAGSGYRRFRSTELDRRLCENAALHLMRSADTAHLRVSLADESGDCTGLCRYLVDCTDRLSVITSNTRLYLEEADRLMEEKGAVIHISKGDAPLKVADLIIAPEPLTRTLPCSGDTVILSAAPPKVAQNAPVIYRYRFELPEKYRALCPEYLDEMYFASALYSLAGAYELGASIFRRCTDGVTIHTRGSLIELLKRRLSAR